LSRSTPLGSATVLVAEASAVEAARRAGPASASRRVSRVGGGDAARGPHQECDAELAFELRYGLAYRGRRHAESLRAAREAPGLGDGHEDSQLSERRARDCDVLLHNLMSITMIY
jgi:hypothetical protein